MKIYLLARVGYGDFHPLALFKSRRAACECCGLDIAYKWEWSQKSDYNEVGRARSALKGDDAVIYELDDYGELE